MRLEVLEPVADGHDNPDALATNGDIELVGSVFDMRDGFSLREFPSCTVRVHAADVRDSLVRVVPVGLVDALDLDI